MIDEPNIRPAAPRDEAQLYEICLRTADAGGDATPLHNDASLPGHVWAAPYLHHSPEHAFVVIDAADVARGYVLAALDSRDFEATLERSWWPGLRARYPGQADDRTPADQDTVALIHDPPVAAEPLLRAYPSHLHIDLLPEVQGCGNGRRLVQTVLASLAAAGSPGVHLGVSARNVRAIGFYEAVGFTELGRNDHGVAFGWRLI